MKLNFSIISDITDSTQNEILRSMVKRSVRREKKIYGSVSLLPKIKLEFYQAEEITIKKGSTLSKCYFPRVAHFIIMFLAGCYEDEDLSAEEKSNEVHYELRFKSVDLDTFKFAYRKVHNRH